MSVSISASWIGSKGHVRVANLLGADESLETLAQAGGGTVALGKRRHHLGVADDEGRADL